MDNRFGKFTMLYEIFNKRNIDDDIDDTVRDRSHLLIFHTRLKAQKSSSMIIKHEN